MIYIHKELCSLHEFYIIGVSEILHDISIPNFQVDLLNYNIRRLERDMTGGGVALYVRNNIIMKPRHDFTQPNIEMIWSEFTFKNRTALIGLCVFHRKNIVVLLDDINDHCEE